MTKMHRLRLLLTLLLAGAGTIAAATDCACDPANSAALAARQCALCREAEAQPADARIFFLKDTSPRKPNRWLALPRVHVGGNHELHDLAPADRTELWTAAIAKAKSLWGDDWGLAYNGVQVRTQCHAHIHIGKLLKGIDTGRSIFVSKPSQIPVTAGEGVWIHPAGNRFHVHLGEQTTETVLLR